jgi:transcriptional regulator with XRE-family HTH domain
MAKNKSKNNGFAERLKQLRIQKGLSQTELANRVNMHNTHISRYERGESSPSSKALKALADCLDVSADFLYDGDNTDAAVADFEDKDLLKMFKQAEKLSKKDKELVKQFLGSFLKKKEMEELIKSH